MGTITDIISITELSRLTNKSRPTIYKWSETYESGNRNDLPRAVLELFDLIAKRGSKKDVYEFCENNFFDVNAENPLAEIIELLRKNSYRLDLKKIKQFIMEEMQK